MFRWLGRGIVVRAGCSPPRRGTSPRATFALDYKMLIDGSVRVADVARPYRYYCRTNRPCRLGPAHQGMKIGAAHIPLDSGTVSGIGVCFCGKDEVGSPCGHRWWYRDLRSFAGC